MCIHSFDNVLFIVQYDIILSMFYYNIHLSVDNYRIPVIDEFNTLNCTHFTFIYYLKKK